MSASESESGQSIDLSTELPETSGEVQLPDYDRSQLTSGIVHFGVGGFHRAHQAMYLDRLLRNPNTFDQTKDWAICGVGVMPSDKKMRDVLTAQSGLYTLVEKAPDGNQNVLVIGSIIDYLYAPDDPEAVLEKLADPATRIVSLTVTEGGYNIHNVTGVFDPNNPKIKAELGSSEPPTSVFGLVTEALRRRREAGTTPFTIMSCDNIQGNGDTARGSFVAYARLVDDDLGAWIESHVPFPNSMVDRITPATTDDDITALQHDHGVTDGWPVVCEDFVQWVLEDNFVDGRPDYQKVGVQVVEDVVPYELMKLRLLNAGHQALGYFGYLSGHRYVHDAAQDEPLATFVRAYMDLEATPTLRPVEEDVEEYKDTLLARFSNSHVRDTVQRLCLEASDRIPKFLLPVVREQLGPDGQGEVRRSAAVVASWARYCEGVDEEGEPIEINDRIAETLREYAMKQDPAKEGGDELAFLTNRELFGDLVDDERFTAPYLETLRSLKSVGAKETVKGLL